MTKSLEERIRILEDQQEIAKLKARYVNWNDGGWKGPTHTHPQAVAEVLGLPAYVFPVAGLCLGWPAHNGAMSPRLGLAATVHVDRHAGAEVADQVAEYDARRNLTRPYRERRDDTRFGAAVEYGWSEDKARQYARPERQDWGKFVRARGFKLD